MNDQQKSFFERMGELLNTPLPGTSTKTKTTDIFHEDRHNRVTITSHFVKNSDRFVCAKF